jgi:hypothetical protein
VQHRGDGLVLAAAVLDDERRDGEQVAGVGNVGALPDDHAARDSHLVLEPLQREGDTAHAAEVAADFAAADA